MGSLFEGSPQSATSYVKSQSDMPRWLQDAIYNQINWSQNIANKPYEEYAGQRVASMDPMQQLAYQKVGENVGQFQPNIGAAMTGTGNLAGTTSVANINQYMNPYTQNVTDRLAQLGARNLQENLLPAISDQFIKAGQFGSAGMGNFGARALRDTQEAVLGQQAQALQQGYSQALSASSSDLARQQGALAQLAALSQTGQQMSAADIAALEAAGLSRQQQSQRQADVDYQEFLKQQQYPQEQLNFLSAQIRGMQPYASGLIQQQQTTTQTGNTGPSPLAQLATALSAGAGLYNTINQ